MSTNKNFNMLLAGFGGQGILFAGKVIAYGGLMDEKEISWLLLMARKCAAAQRTAVSVYPTSYRLSFSG